MQSRSVAMRVSVLVLVASALAVPTALAGSAAMHPELGARLSGMGEHGIVNLQAQATKGKVCWTFDLPTTKGITGASIHTGTTAVVLVRLGKSYLRKGCATASAMTLEHLEAPRENLGARRLGRAGFIGVVGAGVATLFYGKAISRVTRKVTNPLSDA